MLPGVYQNLVGMAGVCALALLGVGLSFSSSLERPADFSFANGSEPATLDPGLATDQVSLRLIDGLFEGLTRQRARDLAPAPGVAERWEVSEDQTRYTFHLRADAQWSDGVPITAEDFVYSWRRVLDPALGAEYAYMLHNVRFAKAYNTYDGLAHALESETEPAFEKFSAEHSGGVSAAEWRHFLGEQQIQSALEADGDARLLALAGEGSSPISGGEIREFQRGLRGVSQRLHLGATEARAHFGVDGGIVALDPHTVLVELAAPTPYFLDITSFAASMPVPRHVVEQHGEQWFQPTHFVSNGAYRLHSWRVNDRIRLVKNERYWGRDEVQNEAIDALPVENATTNLNLYLTGQIDWLPEYYPLDLAPRLQHRPDFYRSPALSVYFFRLNTTRAPFDDVRVRKAINLAVDRVVLTRDVLGLGQIPAYTFVPPGLAGYESPDTQLKYDVPAAKALLAAAGYPDGKGFPRVGLAYNTNEQHKKIAEVVADQLRRNLNIEIVPYNQEWQSFLVTCRALDYEMARAGWNGDYADPNTFLDMWVTNGGNNQTGYSSPRYDALLRAAANVDRYLEAPDPPLADLDAAAAQGLVADIESATNTEQRVTLKRQLRMVLLREAERMLVQDDFPIVPLYYYVKSGLVRGDVRGFYATLQRDDGTTAPNLLDQYPLRDIWRERGAAP